MYWVLYRYASTVNTSVSALVDRIGLFRPYLSNTALIVIAFQVLAFLLMALTQTYIGRWVFSYDNYYTSDSAAAVDTSVGAGMNAEGDAADTIADTDLLSDYTVDTDDDSSVPIHPSDDDVAAIATASVYFAYKKASEMLFLAPLREEVVFRAVIYSIFHQRLQLQAKLPKSLARLYSVFGTSILFGLVHLLNIFGRKYTLIYILLQVSLGMHWSLCVVFYPCVCYVLLSIRWTICDDRWLCSYGASFLSSCLLFIRDSGCIFFLYLLPSICLSIHSSPPAYVCVHTCITM